jgi:tripartite-type tricarboxylate transporter receptor subunit TctC
MKTFTRHALAAVLSLLAAAASAQIDRPVRILVGFAAGGSADIAARLIAERMQPDLKQTVMVDNKPGAGGRIAAEMLKNAPPDGGTIMLAPIVVPVLAPLVFSKLSYDPVVDFAPVARVADFQFGLSVNATNPIRSVSELITWSKFNASLANYGTPAPGSLPHFFGVQIAKATGIDYVHVPFNGGAPAMNASAGSPSTRRPRRPRRPCANSTPRSTRRWLHRSCASASCGWASSPPAARRPTWRR